METLLVLLIIVLIVGAILGGNSFGGTIRKGCGFLLLLVMILLFVGIIALLVTSSNSTSSSQEEFSVDGNSAHFTAIDNCVFYSKPNIESDTLGALEIGSVFFVEEVERFKYFYTITDEDENRVYVRKNCLERK